MRQHRTCRRAGRAVRALAACPCAAGTIDKAAALARPASRRSIPPRPSWPTRSPSAGDQRDQGRGRQPARSPRICRCRSARCVMSATSWPWSWPARSTSRATRRKRRDRLRGAAARGHRGAGAGARRAAGATTCRAPDVAAGAEAMRRRPRGFGRRACLDAVDPLARQIVHYLETRAAVGL